MFRREILIDSNFYYLFDTDTNSFLGSSIDLLNLINIIIFFFFDVNFRPKSPVIYNMLGIIHEFGTDCLDIIHECDIRQLNYTNHTLYK